MRSDISSGVGDTSVLTRRIMAGVVDSVLTLGPWLFVVQLVSESFPVIRDDTDIPRFSPEDQQRIDEIAQGFNRSQEAGGTLYTISGSGLWISVVVLLLAVIGALVVAPILLEGQTLGKKLFALRTISMDGNTPTALHYIGRLVGGLADFFPYFLPGIVGWIVASQDEDRQRLGDQLGRTLVVDDQSIPRIKDTDRLEAVGEPIATTEKPKAQITSSTEPNQGSATALVESGLSNQIEAEEGSDVDKPIKQADDHEKVDFYYSREQQVSEGSQEIDGDYQRPEGSSRKTDQEPTPMNPTPPNGLKQHRKKMSDRQAEHASRRKSDLEAVRKWAHSSKDDDKAKPERHDFDSTDELPHGSEEHDREQRGSDRYDSAVRRSKQISSASSDLDDDITLSGIKLLLREDSTEIEPADEPASKPKSDDRRTDPSASDVLPSNQVGATSSAQAADAGLEWSDAWQAWLSWDKANNQWLRHDSESGKWTPIG